MSDLHELETLVASRTPLILVESREEARVLDLFRRIAVRQGLSLYGWSVSSGLTRLELAGDDPLAGKYRKPAEILGFLRSSRDNLLCILLDFHPYLDDPVQVRLLREIAQGYDQTPRTLVLVSPKLELPPELDHLAARYALNMPTPEELRNLVLEEARGWSKQNHGRRVTAKAQALEDLIRQLAGLTLDDARRLVRSAIYDDGAITSDDLAEVQAAKFRLLDLGGVLSFEPAATALADVAGLNALKNWLAKRRAVFLADQPTPGLDSPKGILLLGVQGAGKSLAAKAVAGAWALPLLRLDFGTLYNKYYGETERNLREALRTAENMSPCVLWIDEIEKGLATDSEGGPSRRIIGTLLTWMAERKAKIFTVATANDIEALPPELLRKGRFDEIFFVDLPKAEARAKIFEIHLAKRGQDPSHFALEQLAQDADGFSGAEIEQAVVSARYSSHAQGRPLTMDDLQEELQRTRPLSVLMAEKIAYLRAWAAERTVSAD